MYDVLFMVSPKGNLSKLSMVSPKGNLDKDMIWVFMVSPTGNLYTKYSSIKRGQSHRNGTPTKLLMMDTKTWWFCKILVMRH